MSKELKLTDVISEDTRAIVASNLTLATTIICATQKKEIDEITTDKVFKTWKSFASSLKEKK
jgi:hypothetical protein